MKSQNRIKFFSGPGTSFPMIAMFLIKVTYSNNRDEDKSEVMKSVINKVPILIALEHPCTCV